MLFVVPSNAIATELSENEIRRHASSEFAILGRKFISWHAFVEKVAGPTGYILTHPQACLILFDLMSSHKFRYFDRHPASMNLARLFLKTIATLKENLITPDELHKILSTRGSIKEYDLLQIYSLYEEYKIKKNIFDKADLTSIAASSIKKCNSNLLNTLDGITFDKFDRVYPGQREIIGLLKKFYPQKGIKEITESKPEQIHQLKTQVYSTRSVIQEARFISHEILKKLEAGVNGTDIALVVPSTGCFLEHFLDEAVSLRIIEQATLNIRKLYSSYINQLLSIKGNASWPTTGRLEDYVKTLISSTNTASFTENAEDMFGDVNFNYSSITRNLTALESIKLLLAELNIAQTFTDSTKLTKQDFINLVLHALGDLGSVASIDKRKLPFNLFYFGDGPVLNCKHVYVPQLAEGVYPSMSGERLFFSESDTLSANPDPRLDEIFPSTEIEFTAQYTDFDKLTGKATESITLTYPCTSESGKEMLASQFLTDFGDAKTAVSIPFVVNFSINDNSVHDINFKAEIENERLTKNITHPQYSGCLTDSNAKALVHKRYTNACFSPTSLEKYAECPFKFYVEKVLNLKPLDELTPEITPKDRGSIIHAVLERFYRDSLKDFKTAVGDSKYKPRLKQLISQQLDKALDEYKEIIKYSSTKLLPMQKDKFFQLIWQVVEKELSEASQLKNPLYPQLCEYNFGTEEKNTLTLPMENGDIVKICGKIDRIDLDESKSRFLIVDYKTGANAKSLKNDILEGKHLQLPIYVEAARQFLFPEILPLGGLLIGVVDANKCHGFVRKEFNNINYAVGRMASSMDDETWNRSIEVALESAKLYASKIRDGQFGAIDKSECSQFCQYGGICRTA